MATNDILHHFSGSVNTFFYFFRGHWKQGAGRRRNAVETRTLVEGGMLMNTRRWTKVECSPSDTPPILLPGICLHRCHSRPTRFARTRRSVTAWQTPGSLRMSGDAQSGSAFHLLPAVSHKLKNPCPARRLREGIMCGRAQGIPVLSVLHLQKTQCSKGQKICGSSSALPAGNNVWQGAGCASQECSAFVEDSVL